MLSLEEFIAKTNSASSQEEVFEIFRKALSYIGYDRVLYSLLTDHPSINKKAGHGLIRNYPDDWMQYYTENGYVHLDPVIKNAFTTSATYTWNGLIKTKKLSKREKRVMDECREAKLLDGAAVALYGPNMEIAGVGLASSSGDINPDKNTLSIIRALANQFHIAYSEFDKQQLNQQSSYIELTPREREILSWSAEGKSIPVIACILSISDSVVKFHLQNIYRKLDVTDRTQAVVKALYLGLINPNRILHLGNINHKMNT